MIQAIDLHAHFGRYDRGADSLKDRLFSGSIQVVRSRAREAGIILTVVSSLKAFFPYGGNPLVGNEEACKVAENYTDILFWAVLNPKVRGSFRQVEKLLLHPKCAGIKIHPVEHNYEIDEQGKAIFEFAASYDALVLSHSGDPGAFPEDLVFFAKDYPKMQLILAHLGNSIDQNFSRQVWALKQIPTGNVYIDTSSMNSMCAGLIEWAVDEIGYERIVFGTDSPLYFAASQKARIEYGEISMEAKQSILQSNAQRLLGVRATNSSKQGDKLDNQTKTNRQIT